MSGLGAPTRALLGVISVMTVLATAGCARTSPPDDPAPIPADEEEPPGEPTGTLEWRRLDAAGPGARRDYSFTGDEQGGPAFLFGGRTGGRPLDDLWSLDPSSGSWEEVPARGPAPRFGHNAVFIEGRLLVFGGQGGPNTFFNDLWEFDPASSAWRRLETGGGPTPRYGAGSALIGDRLVVTHGFTNAGRFDDTWSYAESWSDVSSPPGSRPVKRCLHRVAFLEGGGTMVLFGGQTDGEPFLGDTWLYDPAGREWNRLEVEGPSPRNLYALASGGKAAYLFGGRTGEGFADDLWSFDGTGWSALQPGGTIPGARAGVEFAKASPGRLLMFGGLGPGGELDDLWELAIP